MDGLDSEEQRRALQQLRELTDGADDEVAVSVLSSVDWDVQRAAELIFGTASGSFPAPARPTTMQPFDIDDSLQGEFAHPPPAQARHPSATAFGLGFVRPVFSILTFPLHILSSVVRFIFGILRIPIPQLRFSALNFYRPLGRGPRPGQFSHYGGPDRWLRDLEDETGAVSIGRSKVPRGASSALSLGGQASTSLNARGCATTHRGFEEGRKYLPDFMICSYEDMLKTCQREAKIGCIVLVSDEHDDVPEFKRSTLTDPTFVKILYDNDILVWGGDVRDREAWTAAEKLQATTYPFVAFLALQPRRNPGVPTSSSPSRNTPPPTLTVLSRHQGPSIPSSTSNPAPTSAHTLVSHLERQLLPRVLPFLTRITSLHHERERDRHLREEQDRAFADSARRDKERIMAKMAAETTEREARVRREQEQRLAEEDRKREADESKKRQGERGEWRRWTRRAVVSTVEGGTGSLRVAIRLPNGSRVIHPFTMSSTLTSLYAFVDTQFIPPHQEAVDDPTLLPDQHGEGEQALENHISTLSDAGTNGEGYWGFRIASAYPRVEIPWKTSTPLAEIEQLKGGGQVVVESLASGRKSSESVRSTMNGAGVEDADDGYDTEDSE